MSTPQIEALAFRLRRNGGTFRPLLVDHCMAVLRSDNKAGPVAAKALAQWMETAAYVISNKEGVRVLPTDIEGGQVTPGVKAWMQAVVANENAWTQQAFSRAFLDLYQTYAWYLNEYVATQAPSLAEICLQSAVNVADCIDLYAPISLQKK